MQVALEPKLDGISIKHHLVKFLRFNSKEAQRWDQALIVGGCDVR